MFKRAVLMLLLFLVACSGTLKSETVSISADRPPVYQKVKLCADSVYTPIIDSVKKYYNGHRFSYNKIFPSSRFVYEFLPATLFPFFCMDTVVNDATKVPVYIDNRYCLYSYQDQNGSMCAEVAVLSYATDSHRAVYKKTYRLHSFIYNAMTRQWNKYLKPLDVVFKASAEKGMFEPVLVKSTSMHASL